jgi:hypothetical protein
LTGPYCRIWKSNSAIGRLADLFEHDDSVGASWQRRAGHDSSRRAGDNWLRGQAAGSYFFENA